jgi:hypothetical protein
MCATVEAAAAAACAEPAPPEPLLSPVSTLQPPASPGLRALIGNGAAVILDTSPVIQLGAAPGGGDLDGRGRREVDCLTQAVYYEARSESLSGQQAVAQVVMNRTRDPRFPGSVCGVVFEQTGARATCQFSFACDGSMDRPTEPAAWDLAHSVAVQALHGFTFQPMRLATHYHADYVSPYWRRSLSRIGRIGHHIFYQ